MFWTAKLTLAEFELKATKRKKKQETNIASFSFFIRCSNDSAIFLKRPRREYSRQNTCNGFETGTVELAAQSIIHSTIPLLIKQDQTLRKPKRSLLLKSIEVWNISVRLYTTCVSMRVFVTAPFISNADIMGNLGSVSIYVSTLVINLCAYPPTHNLITSIPSLLITLTYLLGLG